MEYNKRVNDFIKKYVNTSNYVDNEFIQTVFKPKYNNNLTGRELFAVINKKDIEANINIKDVNNNIYLTKEINRRWQELSSDKKQAYNFLSKSYYLY